MSLIETALQVYEANQYVITINTKDLSHADSLLQPAPKANCLNWVLGHIVVNRAAALRLLGEAQPWEHDLSAIYQTGSDGIGPEYDRALALPELLAHIDATQEQLSAAAARATPEILAAPFNARQTVEARVFWLAWHETYHAGQTDYLRRLAGKTEGGVR